MQGLMVHPGWNAVIPCQQSMRQIYTALETGFLDMPIDLSGPGNEQYATLRDLQAIPSHQHGLMLAESGMRIMNALHFTRAKGDASHQIMYKYLGMNI